MISIGDDGNMILHELGSLIWRRLNFTWCANIMLRPDIPRRLKCMSIVENYEGGNMVVGTNYGDIFVISIGREV